MRIVIPALSRDNVAARCLRAERLDCEVVVLEDPKAYARLVGRLWRDGETFCIVEDDIAPWPGAVRQMLDCPRHWCGYHYCLPGRWDDEDERSEELWGTSGCFKVSGAIMHAAPKLYQRFVYHEWNMLDIGLTAALRHVLGLESSPIEHTFHVHKPAVAHAMHYRPEASQDGRGAQEHDQDVVEVVH